VKQAAEVGPVLLLVARPCWLPRGVSLFASGCLRRLSPSLYYFRVIQGIGNSYFSLDAAARVSSFAKTSNVDKKANERSNTARGRPTFSVQEELQSAYESH